MPLSLYLFTALLLFMLLLPSTLTTNIDNGQFNTILSGESNTITSGDYNIINGSSNGIAGSLNIVTGDANQINGSGNTVSGSGNVIVTSEEEFLKALAKRNISFLSGNRTNMKIDTLQESSPKITTQQISSNFSNPVQTPVQQPQSPQKSEFFNQPATTPQTSMKGAQIIQNNQTTPAITQQQPPVQQNLVNQQYPNLVKVKQVIQPPSSQNVSNQLDQNSNYSIKEPVMIKQVNTTAQVAPSQESNNETSNYGIKQPVQVKQVTGSSEVVAPKQDAYDMTFFNSSSTSTGGMIQVQEVKTVDNPQPVPEPKSVQVTKPVQQTLQPQPQPNLNLRVHFNEQILTDLNKQPQIQQTNSQIRDQNDQIILSVKFTQIIPTNQQGTITYLTSPITKSQYINLVFAQNS